MSNFLAGDVLQRNKLTLATGAALGALLLSACSGGEKQDVPTSPVAAAALDATPSASEPSTPESPGVKLPEIDIASSEFGTVDEAISALETSPNAEFNPLINYKPLIDAANGDVSLLKEMGISVQGISINYEMNELFLNKLKPLLDDLNIEQENWNIIKGDAVGSPLSEYKDTLAIQFLLGTIINDYAAGKLDIPITDDTCPEPDMNDVNWEGGYASVFLPPLGVFRYSPKTNECPNPGEVTKRLLEYIMIIPLDIKQSIENELPQTAKAFQIKYDILNTVDTKAKKIITKYSN